MITTYEPGSPEYIALEAAAKLLEVASPNGTKYKVGDCFFDYGQNWMWTTILAEGKNGSWQALNPRDHELITTGTLQNIFRGVENTRNSKFNPDKGRR